MGLPPLPPPETRASPTERPLPASALPAPDTLPPEDPRPLPDETALPDETPILPDEPLAADPAAPGPSPAAAAAPAAPAAKGSGRAYLGLALLGWGLSILLGVTPHEDLLVGGGLAVFGFALAASSPRLPEFRGSLSPWIVAGAGLAVVAGLLASARALAARPVEVLRSV